MTRIDARKCCSHHISLEILQEIIKESLKKEWLLSNIKKQELIEYMKTDEYVMKWAEQTGRIPKDDISWVKDNIEGK